MDTQQLGDEIDYILNDFIIDESLEFPCVFGTSYQYDDTMRSYMPENTRTLKHQPMMTHSSCVNNFAVSLAASSRHIQLHGSVPSFGHDPVHALPAATAATAQHAGFNQDDANAADMRSDQNEAWRVQCDYSASPPPCCHNTPSMDSLLMNHNRTHALPPVRRGVSRQADYDCRQLPQSRDVTQLHVTEEAGTCADIVKMYFSPGATPADDDYVRVDSRATSDDTTKQWHSSPAHQVCFIPDFRC